MKKNADFLGGGRVYVKIISRVFVCVLCCCFNFFFFLLIFLGYYTRA